MSRAGEVGVRGRLERFGESVPRGAAYRWLRRAVLWRLRLGSWSGVSHRLGVPLRVLRGRLRRYRVAVVRLLRRGYRRQERAAYWESIAYLRQQLRSPETKVAMAAAQLLVRVELQQKRRAGGAGSRGGFKRGEGSGGKPGGWCAGKDEGNGRGRGWCGGSDERPGGSRGGVEGCEGGSVAGEAVESLESEAGAEIARLLWQTVARRSVEELRVEWEERFQRECACRRLEVPGESGPEEYWLQPGYRGSEAVGWTCSDPVYQEHVRRRREGWIDYHQVVSGRGVAREEER